MRLYIIQSLKLGTRSFVRNGALVLLTIIAIVGIQIVFMTGLFGKAIFGYALSALERRVDVRLSLVINAPDASKTQLIEKIQALPNVESVKQVQSEQLYTSFQERHANDFLTVQALKELDGNPFGDELVVKLNDAGYYSEFFNNLQKPDVLPAELLSIIEDTDTSHNDELVKRLSNFEKTATSIGWALIAFSFLIILLVLSVVSRFFLSQYTADIKVMRNFGVPEAHIGGWLCVTYSLCIVFATVLSTIGVAGIFVAFDSYMLSLSAGLSMSQWFQTNLLGIVGFVFFTSLAVVHAVVLLFLAFQKKK